jgi:hypothetical protein
MAGQCSIKYQVIDSCSEECFDRGSEIEGCSSGEECSTSSRCHASSSIAAWSPLGRVIVASRNGMEAFGVSRIIEGHLLQRNAPLWRTA